MKNAKALSIGFLAVVLYACAGMTTGAEQSRQSPLSVAVTGKNIEAIVTAVGGNQVDTYSLFKGCILKKDLNVEPAVSGRLAAADALVWTGFLKESAAINARINEERAASPGKTGSPEWIDISKDVARVNVPTTNCYGYLEAELASGDPLFWLNPENGPVIARNVAEGLGKLRPEKRGYFQANAEAFTKSLNADISRWKRQLSQITDLRIFASLCGWQNFTRLGGPNFVVYNATPGSLPDQAHLLEQLKRMKVDIIIVDPGTSSEYKDAFREESGFIALEIPSCIETIPGAKTYSALFENLIQTLLKNSKDLKRR
jgi:ABC-type Zn uptake system ZnuABC Zn-binding protein ZnuA